MQIVPWMYLLRPLTVLPSWASGTGFIWGPDEVSGYLNQYPHFMNYMFQES